MSDAPPRPTFRDPAGSLRLEEDQAVRTIHPASREEVLEFIGSAFCARLQGRGDLVEAVADDSNYDLRLTHPLVPIPSYPWEWTPAQWLAAAQLTLRLGEEALVDGWILKDATPQNILFVGSRPILVDILSFERRDLSSSVWLAYAQYVRTFLLPLVMKKILMWPLSLTLFRRDGYEPVELYRCLGWAQRLSPSAFWPISLPTWLEGKKGSAPKAAVPAARADDPELALHVLRKSIASLRKRTQRAVGTEATSEWSEYSDAITHYTAEQVAKKNTWLKETLAEIKPTRVLDVGANTGEYSRLAALQGAEVVALERDEAAADRLYRMSVATGLAIQTIHADLARPTPAVGWENSESAALLTRLSGKFDVVLMLAVIHHLLLLEQIPLGEIVELCGRLTSRYLIIEWVPATDPMYVSLMRGRDTLYGSISEADLLRACADRFTVRKRLTLENGRTLSLFEKG